MFKQKRRSKKKMVERSISEKLEIIQAREKGLKLEEIKRLYCVGYASIKKWEEAYNRNGIAGLEQTGKGGMPRDISRQVEAAEKVLEDVQPQEPNAGVGKVQGALYRRGFLNLAKETVRRLLRLRNSLNSAGVLIMAATFGAKRRSALVQ